MRWAILFLTVKHTLLQIQQGEKLAIPAPLAMEHRFDKHAQHWNLLGSPLRPCADDMHLMQSCFGNWHDMYRSVQTPIPLKALLLGVTPEIAAQNWGVPVDMTAVDISQAMINSVWPGDTVTRRALCADWLELPDSKLAMAVAEHAFDMILADGVFVLLDYQTGYEKLARAVQRCLKSDGLFLVRPFLRPPVTESWENIFEELWSKRIGSFHAFKWRLLMSLQGDDVSKGVVVVKAWEKYHHQVSSHAHLAEVAGWPVEVIETIDAYQNNPTVYTFPSMDELIEIVSPYLLFTGQETGRYELAERCPMLSFKPR
jgi:SAM-dependent methyltransferase